MSRPADPHSREALIAAARAEFARAGIEHARVEDIARRAGLSKGAFYLHFDSKEAIVQEILVRFFGVVAELGAKRREVESSFYFQEGELTAADVEGDSPRFRALLALECASDVELLETLWRNREIVAVLEGAGGGPYRSIMESFRERMTAQIVGDITAKQAAGRIRPELDPAALGDLLFGGYHAFIRRMPFLREKPDLQGWSRTVCSVICEGMLPRAAATAPANAVAGAPARRPRSKQRSPGRGSHG